MWASVIHCRSEPLAPSAVCMVGRAMFIDPRLLKTITIDEHRTTRISQRRGCGSVEGPAGCSRMPGEVYGSRPWGRVVEGPVAGLLGPSLRRRRI